MWVAWIEKRLLGYEVKTVKMPQDVKGINELVRSIDCDAFAVEDVTIRPGDLQDGKIYRMVDVMIRNVHELEAILKLNDKPYFKIVPRRWQSEYKKQIKGYDYSQKKSFSRFKLKQYSLK